MASLDFPTPVVVSAEAALVYCCVAACAVDEALVLSFISSHRLLAQILLNLFRFLKAD